MHRIYPRHVKRQMPIPDWAKIPLVSHGPPPAMFFTICGAKSIARHEWFRRFGNAEPSDDAIKKFVFGFEMTWQVNHLAPFLLTNLLLPALRAGGVPARIVNVASDASRSGRIHFDDVNRERHILGLAYPQSKLANIMFTYALARRLEGSGITVAAVHPGFVASNFGKKGPVSRLTWAMIRPLQISEEKGAENSLFAATTPDVAAISGRYLVAKKATASTGQSNDPAEVERLWRVSAEMVGIEA